METVIIYGDCHQNRLIFILSAPVAVQIDAIHVDIRIPTALQWTVPPVLNMDIGCLVQFTDDGGRDLAAPQRLGDALYPVHGNTLARYISMRASSTLLSRRRYRSMMAVSKDTPLSRGIWSVTSPEAVVRFRS